MPANENTEPEARSLKTQQRASGHLRPAPYSTIRRVRHCSRRTDCSDEVPKDDIDEAGAYRSKSSGIPRKEVIQPQLPLRLPCYDFTPIIDPTFDGCLPEG